jgi:cobalt-precorrin 5A hydrolase
MATGIVVREIAPFLKGKWVDPAVIAVDDRLNYAIPIVGGHRGANRIARELHKKDVVRLAVISTATEANDVQSVEAIAARLNRTIVNRTSTKALNTTFLFKPVEIAHLTGPKIVIVDDDVAVLSRKNVSALAVGVGARKGIDKSMVLEAINSSLVELNASIEDVDTIATAYLKLSEQGISEAAFELGKPIAFVPKQIIDATRGQTSSRAEMLGLSGVAEPCALALSNLCELLLTKRAYGGVTVAIAR